MGIMKVMDQTGDSTIEWDPADKESTEKAKEKFNALKKDGYEFFEVSETKGKQVKRFSKKAGKLIAAPRAARHRRRHRPPLLHRAGQRLRRGRPPHERAPDQLLPPPRRLDARRGCGAGDQAEPRERRA